MQIARRSDLLELLLPVMKDQSIGQPEVYYYHDPVDFASAVFECRQSRNPKFSFRAWSLQLGYRTPSYLAQVLKRQRKLKLEMARKIALNFCLSAMDQKYFEAMVLLQNCRSAEERILYGELLESVRPKHLKTFCYHRYRRCDGSRTPNGND